jgi:hypothetical protein
MLEIPNNLVKKLNQFQNVAPELVNKYYLEKIKEAVRKNNNRAKFYKIRGTNIVGGVESYEFVEVLQDIQERCIEAEMYEFAHECGELMKQIHIERLISESQNV